MKSLLITALIVLALLLSCKEDAEESLFNPENINNGPTPTITAISPVGSTFAGVGEMIISGANFNPTQPYEEYNQVAFGESETARLAKIVSMTANEIIIVPPVLVGNAIPIRISSRGSDKYSEPFYYKLKAAVSKIQTFGAGIDLPTAVTVDALENVYAYVDESSRSRKIISKITPEEESSIYYQFQGGDVLTSAAKGSPGLKYNSDGNLYGIASLSRSKAVLTITDGGENLFATIPRTLISESIDLDFDQNGNIWIVGFIGNNGVIIKVTPAAAVSEEATAPAPLYVSRVYEDAGTTYLYAAGSSADLSEHKIWRWEINPDGTLGSPEVVLDAAAASWLAGQRILTLTFGADGRIVLGTAGSGDGVYFYDPVSGSNEVLFPDLIPVPINDIEWGTKNFIYATNSDSAWIMKIDVESSGAPYYGR